MGRGRGKEGREGNRGGNEEEGSEVRQRELAACKNLQSKNEIRNRKRNSKLGLGRLATAQQVERKEGKREQGESAGIPHNSADKGALLLLINFIAEIRQCCTLYKHTHTHATRTQQLYKGNYLRVLQTAQLFPLFHCVCVFFCAQFSREKQRNFR